MLEERRSPCYTCNGDTYTQSAAENVSYICYLPHIFRPLCSKFNQLTFNKQITTNCFVFNYNPIVYLSHIESIQMKENYITALFLICAESTS